MRIVHTMIRVKHLDESLDFYCDGLGMEVLKKKDYESGRFTNCFVGYGSEDDNAVIELTYNWDTHEYDVGDGFGISPSECPTCTPPVTTCGRRESRSRAMRVP